MDTQVGLGRLGENRILSLSRANFGCHEGRAPVFVKTDGDQKILLVEALLNDKDKVIKAMNLPQDNPKVMPPYGRPRPSAEELKTMSAL